MNIGSRLIHNFFHFIYPDAATWLSRWP